MTPYLIAAVAAVAVLWEWWQPRGSGKDSKEARRW